LRYTNSIIIIIIITIWIDECERADEIFESLSLHPLRLLPELSAQDLTQLQSEDPEMGPAYTVMSQDLEPTPDEFRGLPLESRHLLSMRPEVFLQDGLMLRTRKGSTHLIVPVSLRHRFFEITVMRRVSSSLYCIFFVVFVPPCICPQTRPLVYDQCSVIDSHRLSGHFRSRRPACK